MTVLLSHTQVGLAVRAPASIAVRRSAPPLLDDFVFDLTHARAAD